MPAPTPQGPDVANREELFALYSSDQALVRREQFRALAENNDREPIVPAGIGKIDTVSSPDGNSIHLKSLRPDSDEVLPCVYYNTGRRRHNDHLPRPLQSCMISRLL